MKKLIALSLVFVFIFSLISFLPVSISNSPKTMVKAFDGNNSTLHPTGCILAPVKPWPKIDVNNLKNELISKGITVLPTSVDLSPQMPPVGDQKSQGSCTAWATGYYYKTFQEGKEQSWSLASADHQFSPAFVYNQINGGHDWGSSIPDALQLLVDKGCDTLAVFPYNQYDYTTQPTLQQLQLALPFKASSYANVFQGQGNCTDDTINILKSWLTNGDTFVIAIPVYSEFDDATGSSSYVVPPHDPNDSPRGWHALQVVGYNDDLYYNDGTNHYGAFKIVNSWGTGYGYGGYVNLSYNFFKVDVGEAWTMVDAATPQDFTIGLNLIKQSVMPGGTLSYTILLSSLSGFNGSISLSVSGLPSGITYSLSSTSVTPPQNVTLTLNIDSSVSSSTYSFTVSGTYNSTTHTISGVVDVKGSTGLLLHIKNQLGNPAAGADVQLFSDNYFDYWDTTDSSGDIYFPDVSGTYTALISSFNDHFGLVKSITAPGEYTFDTTGTQHVTVTTKKKDSSPLSGYIWFVPSEKAPLEVGYSSGTLSVDITPGTYTVMISSLNSYYQFALPNIVIDSGTTQITLDASTMPTGTVTLTQYGFEHGYVVAWGSYCNWAYGFYINSQTVITYSADTYDVRFSGYLHPQDGSSWQYSFSLTDAPVTVADGSSQTIDVGGTLSITTQPEKTSYYLGEQIKLNNKVSDAYGNRLTGIYEYLPTASFDPTAPIQKDEVTPGYSASFGPLVKVIGPDSNVYYQSSSTSGFYNTYFTSSGSWPTGIYTVNISLYTGPLQGVVYGNAPTFTLNSYPPDQYEPDDTPQDAKQIPTDGTVQTHNFHQQGDVDWIKFTAVEGKTYTIDTLNLELNCDTVIYLYAPDGTTIIDYNDDFDSLASRIDFEVPVGKGGTYYIQVYNYNPDIFGDGTNYDIRVYPALQISFSPEFVEANTLTDVTVTVTQDGNPVSGASVYDNYTNTTQTTNLSGQVLIPNVNIGGTSSVYVEVNYSNYKRSYTYFYTLFSDKALIEVKPKDKNGYYLTNFYLEGFRVSASAEYPWWTEWSSYRNTQKVPVPAGNNLAIVVKNSYDTGDGSSYYMVKSTTSTALNKLILPFDASTETYELSINGIFNGSGLSYYYLWLRNEAYNYIERYNLSSSDSSGNKKVYVIPGNYTALLKQDNSNGSPDVLLIKEHIAVSSNTVSTVSYNTSDLGTLNRHAYDGSGNEIKLWLAGTTKNINFSTYSTGETLLLSPSTYQWDYAGGRIYNYPDNWWYYFIPSETSTVSAGSTQTINFGGHLTETITTDKGVYTPGETVNIEVRIDDAYDHPLDQVYHYNYSSSPATSRDKEFSRETPPYIHPSKDPQVGKGNTPHLTPDFDIGENATPGSYSEYSYIHLVVKDSTNATVVDTSNYDFWDLRENGYNYTLSSTAPLGTYTINTSLATGPYQGTVTGGKNFYVGTLPAPIISLSSPNGSESLTPHTTYDITFSVSGDTSSIHYFVAFYTVDDGNSYEFVEDFSGNIIYTLFDPLQSTYSMPWYVPVRYSTMAKVVVYAMDINNKMLAFDVSDNHFKIADAGHPGDFSVNVTAPTTGSTVTPGTDFTITWSTTGTIPSDLSYYVVFISYEDGRNGSWHNICEEQHLYPLSGESSYIWHVPSSIRSDRAKIVVYPMNSSNQLVGNSTPISFKVLPPSYNFTISITHPLSGENLTALSNYNIQWTTSNEPTELAGFFFYLSVDNGTSWELLRVSDSPSAAPLFISKSSSPYSYSWNVWMRLSTNCKLMIIAVDSSNISTYSILGIQISDTFNIVP